MGDETWEEHVKKWVESHKVNPNVFQYAGIRAARPCRECEKLKAENEGLRRMGESLQSLINDATSALAKREEELASLKERKFIEPVEKPHICPGCKGVVEWVRSEHYQHAEWHKSCLNAHHRNQRIAKGRRRLRRWRNFKFFLARAFWFIW